jgi:acetyl-CoA acetyltransferase
LEDQSTFTAGNSSGIVDGASAAWSGAQPPWVVRSWPQARTHPGLCPVGSDPALLSGPVRHQHNGRYKASMDKADIDLFELNEALPQWCYCTCEKMDISTIN